MSQLECRLSCVSLLYQVGRSRNTGVIYNTKYKGPGLVTTKCFPTLLLQRFKKCRVGYFVEFRVCRHWTASASTPETATPRLLQSCLIYDNVKGCPPAGLIQKMSVKTTTLTKAIFD